MLRYRGLVPMVFQDPFSSINPVFRVSHGIMRGLKLHRPELSAADRRAEAERVFETVGLNPAAEVLQRYPHELSGGQRQRVGFAQALALRPKLILADEPVSMLDVSIRIGLLNLMTELRDKAGVSILYITHDIASARYVADRLIVMYAGQIAEAGPVEDILASPRHPYTQLLLSAVPDPRAPLGVSAETDKGEPPRVIDPTPGCRFRWRCPLAIDECHHVTPPLGELLPGHDVACHVAQTGAEVRAVRMKLAVIGGGSTYTPELVDGIARLAGQVKVTELVLVDPDESRLAVVGPFSARIMRAYGHPAALRWTASLDDGLDGAGAVLLQLRIGGQAARHRDETWPMECGCIGQETTGAGGFAKALRTVPVVLDIAKRAERRAAEDAWIIDFTNPVGIVTRALLDGGHRAIGLCNVAIGFQREFAALLGVPPGKVMLDHVGLNHLTWERAAVVDGTDRLPDLIAAHGERDRGPHRPASLRL